MIEKKLQEWVPLFQDGKTLTVDISFNYVDQNCHSKGGKHSTSSTTQLMLAERESQVDAKRIVLVVHPAGTMYTIHSAALVIRVRSANGARSI
jgi:hypothetical protein